jgi:hypothetical protein
MDTDFTTSCYRAALFALLCFISSAIGSEREKTDTIKLNVEALEHAKELIAGGHVIMDNHGAWWGHKASTEQKNEFIRRNGFSEYARWHLGIDDRHAENSKARYKFPYGDFKDIHRCAVLAVQARAAEYRHYEIEKAALELKEMIEMKRKLHRSP